jgi:hypothetical protein
MSMLSYEGKRVVVSGGGGAGMGAQDIAERARRDPNAICT